MVGAELIDAELLDADIPAGREAAASSPRMFSSGPLACQGELA